MQSKTLSQKDLALIKRAYELKDIIASAKRELDNIEHKIKESVEEDTAFEYKGTQLLKVSYYTTKTFNKKKFAEDYPDLLPKYE